MTHFITSILLTIAIYPFFKLYSLWILVGGFLIDFDHYLWSMFKQKTFSLKKSYYYHLHRSEKKNYDKDLLHLFHTIEFWIFMILASFISYKTNNNFLFYMFSITFLGMVLHLSLDFSQLTKRKRLDARAISLIMWIKRNKFKH